MATKIQWTNETWNPVRGCSRVSPGCDNCYAMGQARRQDLPGGAYEALTTIRKGRVDWAGVARFVPEALDIPLRWRRPRMVFVNSMSDLFHPSLAFEQIAAVFGVMAACPQHTFQLLTKRPDRAKEFFAWVQQQVSTDDYGHWTTCIREACNFLEERWVLQLTEDGIARPRDKEPWPLRNVWLGASVENQEQADKRVPELLLCPAALHWVSAEPLLARTDFTPWVYCPHDYDDPEHGIHCKVVDWIVCGGESGHRARPCALEWLESIVEQCRDAGVPVFVKQLGSYCVSEERTAPADHMQNQKALGPCDHAPDGSVWAWRAGLEDRQGGNPDEWPDDLRVRQFPNDRR